GALRCALPQGPSWRRAERRTRRRRPAGRGPPRSISSPPPWGPTCSTTRARLMSADPGGIVPRVAAAGPATEFALTAVGSGSRFTLRSTARDRHLVARAGQGALALGGGSGTPLEFMARGGCTPFPEAGVDATVHRPATVVKHGRIF